MTERGNNIVVFPTLGEFVAEATDRGTEASTINSMPGLKGGGGGGTSGDVSDEWKSHVETQLKQLREDVQQIRNWIVAAVAAPLLAIVGLYVYTGTKFDAVTTKFDTVEDRIVGVENKLTPLAVDQAKINAKLDLLLERTATKNP